MGGCDSVRQAVSCCNAGNLPRLGRLGGAYRPLLCCVNAINAIKDAALFRLASTPLASASPECEWLADALPALKIQDRKDRLLRLAADFGCDGTRKQWIVDSGASEHFIFDTGELDYVADDAPGGKVAVANGVVCPVTAIGPVTLRVSGFRPTGRAGEQRDEQIITTLRLGRVSVVPALTKRLLSVRRLFDCDGVRIDFNGRDFLTLPSGDIIPLNTAGGRFRLDTESALSAAAAADSDGVRLRMARAFWPLQSWPHRRRSAPSRVQHLARL